MCSTVEDRLMFCIDFEDEDLVSDTEGVYRPWILNDGVTIVDNAMGANCPQGQRCGFFNESVLEVPFFSNNYVHWHTMSITFNYRMIQGTSLYQGIISNDCFNQADYADGSSLYCSASVTDFMAGLKTDNSPLEDANASVVSRKHRILCVSFIYIYIYVCVCVYIYIYIYIYVQT